MMRKNKFLKGFLFLVLAINTNKMNAQNKTENALNSQQQSLVKISALTATGDLMNFKNSVGQRNECRKCGIIT
ncbi:MAG: hypothetical protein C0430_03540 [Flavobacterium sp.]|nr:hypothetical protein [Flavobacterium sp.]